MKPGSHRVRTVITGVGVVSPIGVGNDDFWSSLIAGRSGIGPLRAFPCDELPSRLAAEIPDFDAQRYVASRKLLKAMSRDVQLGVSAAALAVRDADLPRGRCDPDRLGVVFGAGRIASLPEEFAGAVRHERSTGDFDLSHWSDERLHEVCPLWLLGKLPNMPACLASIEHDARGPNNTITSRDSSALLALAEAVGVIERGAADCMIVGACSSNVSPLDIVKLSLYEGLSRRWDDPSRACRPFDFERDGAVVGEGAAAFMVEELGHAVRRGAEVYAEVLGVAAGCDGRGYANGAGGTGLVRAIGSALRQAGIEPCELGHINAHGKSTQRDDLVESRAYHRALGDAAGRIPVTALKSYFGQFDAGAGAVELAGTLLALRHGEVPMTLNYEVPDPRCRLDVVHAGPVRLRSRTALTVNRTALGQSAAAIVRAM